MEWPDSSLFMRISGFAKLFVYSIFYFYKFQKSLVIDGFVVSFSLVFETTVLGSSRFLVMIQFFDWIVQNTSLDFVSKFAESSPSQLNQFHL